MKTLQYYTAEISPEYQEELNKYFDDKPATEREFMRKNVWIIKPYEPHQKIYSKQSQHEE